MRAARSYPLRSQPLYERCRWPTESPTFLRALVKASAHRAARGGEKRMAEGAARRVRFPPPNARYLVR